MNDQTLFSIFFSAMVVNNFTLAMFLGLCPFMGVSARVETALRMGLANIFVLILTSISAWILNTFILETVPFLRIISFIIVVASLVQIVEMVVKKLSPTLFRQLGIFLPLMTTNCAIFGLAIFQTNRGYDFLQGITFAVGAGLGLTLALVLMASIRESVEFSDVPDVARGTGLVLIIGRYSFYGVYGLRGAIIDIMYEFIAPLFLFILLFVGFGLSHRNQQGSTAVLHVPVARTNPNVRKGTSPIKYKSVPKHFSVFTLILVWLVLLSACQKDEEQKR